MTIDPVTLRTALLHWYDANARNLAWRVLPSARAGGTRVDPYRVWLSEIMLQQTTIAAVTPYFERFLSAFPNVEALAAAPLDAVLSLWAGLGYYARGRNLHACAIVIADAGGFPQTPAELEQLPGIGPYTGAAIASIAFDYPAVPVDGNVERVLSRLMHIDAVLPAGKPVFRDAAAQFADAYRPGDFAQALMDLGSIICTPRAPSCAICPWSASCLAYHASDMQAYPRKVAKKIKPIRYGVVFIHINENGVLVSRRPEKGLLGGMLEVPGTGWRAESWSISDAMACAPVAKLNWQLAAPVRHIFTHFDLRLTVYFVLLRGVDVDGHSTRIPISELNQAAIPSVFMKTIIAATNAATRK